MYGITNAQQLANGGSASYASYTAKFADGGRLCYKPPV